MKNLIKLCSGFLLAFGVLGVLSVNSEATVGVRSPKRVYNLNYTTSISSVTPFTVVDSTTLVKPGAVYELNLGTGTAGDFLMLFDTNPVNASALVSTNAGAANSVYQLGPKFYYSSTTANTKITFDPPLMFVYGLMAIQSAATNQASITYEDGRGLTGQ
jgi:hypothetical protein